MLGRHLDVLFNDSMHRLGPGTDFSAYFRAGRYALDGRDIYAVGPGYGFRYHPLFALTFLAALSRLGRDAAFGVWVALNEIALVADILVLGRLFTTRREILVGSLLLLFFSPILLEIYMGNSSLLTASLMLWGFVFYARGKMAPFAALWVVSILVKPTALVFVPILLFDRRWKLVLAVLAFTAVTAAPHFVLHPESFRLFIEKNLGDLAVPGALVHGGNQGLHCLLADLCTRGSGIPTNVLATFSQLPAGCRALLFLLPLLLIVVSAWQNHHRGNDLSAAVFLWSATYLLGYKEVWEHSYAFAFLAFAHLYLSGAVDRRLTAICAAGMALPTFFPLYDLPGLMPPVDPEHFWGFATSVLHHVTKVVWIAIPYGVLLWNTVRGALRPSSGA